jgi:hypothetical protein
VLYSKWISSTSVTTLGPRFYAESSPQSTQKRHTRARTLILWGGIRTSHGKVARFLVSTESSAQVSWMKEILPPFLKECTSNNFEELNFLKFD